MTIQNYFSYAKTGGFILALALFSGSNTVQGAILRVRKDGTGNYTTIQACVNAMVAKDTCLVGPGVYAERISFPSGKSGLAGNLTILKAETPGTVDVYGFDTQNCNYLRIEGFNISPLNTSQSGVSIRSSNVQVVSNYIHDVYPAGVSGTGNNALVAGNRIYKPGKGLVINGNSWLVENNEIERLQKYATVDDADYCIFFGANHIIRNNYFHGTLAAEIGSAHVDGFQTWDYNGEIAQHIRIEGNRVIGYYHQGFMGEATIYSNSFDIVICNNIFRGATSWGVCAARRLRDVKVVHNLFMDINSNGVGINEGSTGEVENNIFYNVTSWDSGTPASFGTKNIWYRPGFTIGSRFNGDLVNVNPQLVDVTTDNFHLKTNSPAINAGIVMTNAPYDLDGVARPQGAGWDIGMYEFVSSPPFTNAWLLTPFVQSGNLVFTLVGTTGRTYGVESSSNAQSWFQVQTVTLSNGAAQISRPLTGGRQFFRSRILP